MKLQLNLVNIMKNLKVLSASFIVFATMFQISCSFKIVGKNKIRIGDYLVQDTLNTVVADTAYCYPFTLPVRGNYSIDIFCSSEKAFDEKMKDKTSFSKSIEYKGDRLIRNIQIVAADSIILNVTDSGYCVLQGYRFVRFQTTQNKIPVNTPLELRISYPRMDCKFPYDDVKYYIGLQRASFIE